MKVVLVVSGFPSAKNPSRSNFNLIAAQLLNNLHEISIVQIRAWKPGRKIIDYGKVNDLSIVYISFPLFNFKYFQSIFLNHFFLELILRFQKNKIPSGDIIHSVGGGLTAYGSYMISRVTKTPFIIQYIGSDVNFYLSKYKDKEKVNIYIGAAAHHVFNSRELKNCFKNLFPKIKNKDVIYRGIDLNGEYQLIPKSKDPVILYLGGLTSGDFGKHIDNLKGGVTLLQAWKELDSITDLVNVKMFYGGPNSNDYYKYLNISELNYPNSFMVVGELSKSDVRKYMNLSNILIVPSLFEGLPNIIYEGMLYGNMIIGTKTGGIPEVMDRECGILINPNSPEAILEAFQKVIQDKNKIIDFSEGSKKRIKEFDNMNFLNNYTKVYNKYIVS